MRTSPTQVREPATPAPDTAPVEQPWYMLELRVAFKLKPGHAINPSEANEIRTIGAALGEVAAENLETALPENIYEGLGAGTIRFGMVSAELAEAFERQVAANREPAFSVQDPSNPETIQ